uniref:SFRICE_016287 n=1 Tax=Spodoptera frugiperda TaxID=7108 RepID=A0A2H1V8L6_SPOFR
MLIQYQVTSIFDRPFKKVATVGNAASAFRVTGIYPFDDNLFTEADFAPSSVTDMFGPSADTVAVNPPISSSVDAIESQKQQSHQAVSVAHESIASASADLEETQGIERLNILTVAEVHHQPTLPIPEQHIILTAAESHALSDPMDEIEEFQEQHMVSPSILRNISNNQESHIPLICISPLPKATQIQTRRKNGSKSEIITNSPFKNMLEEKEKKIDKKSQKTRKPKMNMETKRKYKTTNSKKKSSTQEYYCPLCREKYGETAEVWIECTISKSWWHEACTSYEIGIFTCDLCIV